MIHGARFWVDPSKYSIQTNNPTEEQLRKNDIKFFLETCGPTAAVNCINALGVNTEIICPGNFRPQSEEVLSDYFNDPRNYDKFRNIRPDVDPSKTPGNRVPQYYPAAAFDVFGVKAIFTFDASYLSLTNALAEGKAVQMCLKSPGHYLAVVAYDDFTNEIIFHDSWPARVGGNGFARRMTREEYLLNSQNYLIIYGGAA